MEVGTTAVEGLEVQVLCVYVEGNVELAVFSCAHALRGSRF
jgi:hypothetical protein